MVVASMAMLAMLFRHTLDQKCGFMSSSLWKGKEGNISVYHPQQKQLEVDSSIWNRKGSWESSYAQNYTVTFASPVTIICQDGSFTGTSSVLRTSCTHLFGSVSWDSVLKSL